MEYLSDEWFEAANAALSTIDPMDTSLVVEQHIEDRDGILMHQLVIGGASVSFERDTTRPATVTLTQARATADAVRAGELSALDAIQGGLIRIDGDPRPLVAASELLSEIDQRLSELNI